jgi:predicted ATP-binding protein involved in virulence
MDFNYIRIEKLFGQFDYRIDFSDLSNNVKIITAPNGYGKSTILKIIDNFINQKFDQLLNYEFASFEISFNRSIFYIKEKVTLYIYGIIIVIL